LRGFGDGKRAFFWLKEGKPDPQAVHVGFEAKDHAEVDAFYKAAVAAGGKSLTWSFVKLRLANIQSVNAEMTFPTRALGYSHSKEACDHEEPVRCDGRE
jgi:hypothetical protein